MSDTGLDAAPRSPAGIVVPPEVHPEPPARGRSVALLVAIVVVVLGSLLGWLFWIVPKTEDGIAWGDPLAYGGWMAWTLATALFFWVIAALILLMLVLAIRLPETPRVGILRIETTRGDRLFITLLGSAFINLAWLGLVDRAQWGALVVCLLWALAVFRWV